jgi:hypothetical protein
VSPCDPIYGSDRKPTGFICTRGPKKDARVVCQFCGGLNGSLLCDGPGPTPRKTCDAKMCGKCAISIRPLDVDFCPRCAGLPGAAGCPVASGVRADPCSGPVVKKEGTCLKHAFLFNHWLREGGFERVYSRDDLSREQKRLAFKTWLQAENGRAHAETFGRMASRSEVKP